MAALAYGPARALSRISWAAGLLGAAAPDVPSNGLPEYMSATTPLAYTCGWWWKLLGRTSSSHRLPVDGVVPRPTAAVARFSRRAGDTTEVVAVVVLHVRGVHAAVPLRAPLPADGVPIHCSLHFSWPLRWYLVLYMAWYSGTLSLGIVFSRCLLAS